LYLVVVAALIYLVYAVAPPVTEGEDKIFNTRVGMILTAAGAFVGMIVTFFTLNAQIEAARQLEKDKLALAKELESEKTRLAKELESEKARLAKELAAANDKLSKQNSFLDKILNEKTNAQNALFVASTRCYRELQMLANGIFSREDFDESYGKLKDAEGLNAHLDDGDRKLFQDFLQHVMLIDDEIMELKVPDKQAYQEIWKNRAPAFGAALNAFLACSLFRNKSILPLQQDPNERVAPPSNT
jgi:hypothetical protein